MKYVVFGLLWGANGCGNEPPWALGELSRGTLEGPGQPRSYFVRLPESYRPQQKHPLLLYFHGWGGDAKTIAENDDLDVMANREGWISIHVTGMSDVPSSWIGEWGAEFTWGSWNGSGTVSSPGPAGAICSEDAPETPCYESCGDCKDHCWWTTCTDDVSFVSHLLDHLESSLCIDTDRIVASGFSNGGVFLYELAAHEAISKRLAAIIPVSGLPHIGFNRGPATAMQLFGLWGRVDDEVPGFHLNSSRGPNGATVSADGFYYTPLDAVLELWSTGEPKKFETSLDGILALSCSSHGSVVACTWAGGHEWPGYWYPHRKKSTDFPLASTLVVQVFLRHLVPRKAEELALASEAPLWNATALGSLMIFSLLGGLVIYLQQAACRGSKSGTDYASLDSLDGSERQTLQHTH